MTRDYSQDFNRFEGSIWLNCAHQGPLPRAAVEEVHEAVMWKTALHLLGEELFFEVPLRLRRALGKLIGAPADDIILGNSASYGLHLLANGTRWDAGDEVLLVAGDFPADLLPWFALQERGVRVRLIHPQEQVLQPDELESHFTKFTKLLCVTYVHSFNGHAIDVHRLGRMCRANNVTFVVNCSQALGARTFDVSQIEVDAITSVGFKWLCGPYGTGFCWMRPELRESLKYNQAYWLAMLTPEDLAKESPEIDARSDLGARRYDIFGTANFFNFKPWTAAVEYLLEQGIDRIAAHNHRLVSQLIEGLDGERFDVLSPRESAARSSLVFVSHKDPTRNSEIYKGLKKRGVYVAFRAGKLRFSPHLYNTTDDLNYALSVLQSS